MADMSFIDLGSLEVLQSEGKDNDPTFLLGHGRLNRIFEKLFVREHSLPEQTKRAVRLLDDAPPVRRDVSWIEYPPATGAIDIAGELTSQKLVCHEITAQASEHQRFVLTDRIQAGSDGGHVSGIKAALYLQDINGLDTDKHLVTFGVSTPQTEQAEEILNFIEQNGAFSII